MTPNDYAVAGLIFLMAVLYSSVGHAGSSGFQAAMAIMGVSAAVMKPTALTLNILVGIIGTIRFYRAGCFSWPLFWKFTIGSIPFAFVGGIWRLSDNSYNRLAGAVLLFAAVRLFLQSLQNRAPSGGAVVEVRDVAAPVATGWGVGIGLLSGLTGTGGGIFLSPLLRLMNWADMRHVAGVSVAFILVNSIAGIAGFSVAGMLDTHKGAAFVWPHALGLWAAAAVVGGVIGSGYGSRRLRNVTLTRLLAVVLVIAGVKLLFLTPGAVASG